MYKYYSVIYSDLSGPTWIGEKDKKKRICRFCNRSINDGATFKKRAHAISEALGNKNIYLNEECDTCNEYFGNNVETHLIRHFDFLRTLHGIKIKKNKIPTLKKKNSSFMFYGNQDKRTIVIDRNRSYGNLSISQSKPQIIYKALVKYGLSIIDNRNIKLYKDALNWIRNGEIVENLPHVYRVVLNKDICHFEIHTYIACGPYKDKPFTVCVFWFTNVIYFFKIPLFNQIDQCYFGDFVEHWMKINGVKGDPKLLDLSSMKKINNEVLVFNKS